MSQLVLFSSNEWILADDERGRITYQSAFVDPATADAWFAELRHAVDWRSERRQMYDRQVDVPRLTGHYRLDPPPKAIPAALLDAAARVTAWLLTAITCTSCGRDFPWRCSRSARRAG